MPDLLLELFSEEIPARMQQKAARDLERMMNERLIAAGLLPEGVKAFAGPRRLALIATGLPLRQPDRKEEKKGPRVGALEKAIEGFLKSAGLSSLDQCEIVDDKKGPYYVAKIEEKGRETADVLAEAVPVIVREFPWPKSMRWGDGELRWVRPLQSVLCCFNDEIVPFEIDGLKSGDETRGHRRFSSGPIRARNFDKYVPALTSAKVILDGRAREDLIAADAKTLCEAQGLELVEDKGLLAEVSGLAEWPVVMMGSFDGKFLALPDEVLTASMRGHQKYFSVKDPKTGRLASKFVYVANIDAPDAGKSMRAGYERVLTARLSDAWYLYHQDLKVPLESRVKDLDRVTFFEGLGSIGDKARRVAALAKEIAPAVGADPGAAEKAALLAKADLTTGMVYEFPELQGLMGRYYYLAQHDPSRRGLAAAPQDEGRESRKVKGPHPEEPSRSEGVSKDTQQIADAIRDHYKPQGTDDNVPTAPVSVAVALADKIDTLNVFWEINKLPTGSSDPYALRRACIGIIQTVLQNEVRTPLSKLVDERIAYSAQRVFQAMKRSERLTVLRFSLSADEAVRAENHARSMEGKTGFWEQKSKTRKCVFDEPSWENWNRRNTALIEFDGPPIVGFSTAYGIIEDGIHFEQWSPAEASFNLRIFFHDRLKVYLKDKGHKYDAIDAVLTKADGALEDDLVLIVRKLEALEAFLKTDDGANLAAGYKRAANIVKAEEKKDVGRKKSAGAGEAGKAADFIRPTLDERLLQQAEEKALFAALKPAEEKAEKAVAAEKFADAMTALASLRAPIDAFFDKVTVNADDAKLRANRLALLNRFIAATATVADLGKLEG